MNSYIEFESAYGTIIIETVEEKKNITKFSSGSSTIQKAKQSFEESIDVVKSIAQAVVGKLTDSVSTLSPDEIEVKLGLKFTTEANAFIAKTSAEGNLEVTLKWKKESLKTT